MNLAPPAFTLRQLQYAVAVADALSFRRAAELCRVAQPSLSAQVAQLEEALGVRLFERDARRVRVTPAGRALVDRARALLLAAGDLAEAARTLSDPLSGVLRLGLIPTIGPYLLPEIAPLLRREYPKLTLVWSEEKTATLVERIEAGALDGAVLALEAGGARELPRVVLGRDPFVFAAAPGHPLARAKRPLSPEALAGERVLVLDEGHCFREQALSYCARSGADEAGYRATSLATLVHMAAAGLGVTLLPALAVGLENRGGSLRVRRFEGREPARTVALVWRRGHALEATLRAVGEKMKGAWEALAGVWQ
jgi:LysR family transcriptional regulator, hydrogen peroxide-inducible genes activator